MAVVLVVDDQDRLTAALRKALPRHVFHGPARNLEEARRLLDAQPVDVAVLDMHFDIPAADLVGVAPDAPPAEVTAARRTQGLAIFRALRPEHPDLPVVFTTTRAEVDLGRLAPDEEYTYFLDDESFDARTLGGRIEVAAAQRRSVMQEGPVFWGRTPGMRRIRHRLGVLARGRLPVVLLGPTGTGKSLLARHIVHARSARKGAFVAVDLSTVPKDLMAAHLFGSVRGAYTGSIADRVGAFEAADKGTLFLDEIGNLTADAQKILLTVLQDGVITRVGDLRERAVDVKVVVATHEDLADRVARGDFRADLWMRLNPAAAIHLPPLGDRRADLLDLVRFCVRGALARPALRGLVDEHRARHRLTGDEIVVQLGGALPPPEPGALTVHLPDRAVALLDAHPWPGNLRELAMVVENAALFALAEDPPGGATRPDLVQIRPRVLQDLLPVAPGPAATPPAARRFIDLVPSDTLNKVAVDVERQYFVQLYRESRGDFAAMAVALLGDAGAARKVQLRFNQLGLKVRDLRGDVG